MSNKEEDYSISKHKAGHDAFFCKLHGTTLYNDIKVNHFFQVFDDVLPKMPTNSDLFRIQNASK